MVVADLLAGVSYIDGRLGHSGTNHVNTPTGLGQREMKTTSLVFGAGLKMPWGEAGQVFGVTAPSQLEAKALGDHLGRVPRQGRAPGFGAGGDREASGARRVCRVLICGSMHTNLCLPANWLSKWQPLNTYKISFCSRWISVKWLHLSQFPRELEQC